MYDLQFKNPPTVVKMGGSGDIESEGTCDIWIHPENGQMYQVYWISKHAQKAEADPEFIQSFFFQLPQWISHSKKHCVKKQSNLSISWNHDDHWIKIE